MTSHRTLVLVASALTVLLVFIKLVELLGEAWTKQRRVCSTIATSPPHHHTHIHIHTHQEKGSQEAYHLVHSITLCFCHSLLWELQCFKALQTYEAHWRKECWMWLSLTIAQRAQKGTQGSQPLSLLSKMVETLEKIAFRTVLSIFFLFILRNSNDWVSHASPPPSPCSLGNGGSIVHKMQPFICSSINQLSEFFSL